MRYLDEDGYDWTVELDVKLEKIKAAAEALISLVDGDLADFIPEEDDE